MTTAQPHAEMSTFHLRRRTPGSFILVPFPRLGRSIRCQGHLEAETALVLSSCPRVQLLREQPLAIWYAWRATEAGWQIQLQPPGTGKPKSNGIRITYTAPDFLVQMVDGAERLVEVKPSQRLDDPIVQRKLSVARLFAAQKGWRFSVITERKLRRGCLLSNVRLIRRYGRIAVDAAFCEGLIAHVPGDGISLAALRRAFAGLSSVPKVNSHILHLLFTGGLSVDPCSAALSEQSIVFPGGAVTWDPFESAWAPSGCTRTGELTEQSGSRPRTSS